MIFILFCSISSHSIIYLNLLHLIDAPVTSPYVLSVSELLFLYKEAAG